MAYLSKDDYTTVITQEYLDQILTQAAANSTLTEDAIREDAELTAQAEITSYLYAKYIIEDEFAKTVPDETRNRIIMRCAMNIALYNIHFVINPRDVPETREKAYDACLEKMAAFRDGELLFPPPPADGGMAPRPPEEGGTSRININSHIKFISKPYSDIYPEDETV